MKRILPFFILYSLLFTSAEAADCYRLYLTDKEGSEYCALSERAIQRRERQGIALDSADLVVSPQYKKALQEAGWQIVTESRWLNTVVVQSESGKAFDNQAQRAFPFVFSYEQVSGDAVDSWAVSKWRLPKASTTSQLQEDFRSPMLEVHGEALYDAGFRGQGMLVTVLDGGFQNLCDYPFLFDKVVGWYDCYRSTDSQFWTTDSHGTNVTSIMATDSIYGVWGTAPDASYFLIRTEYSDTESPLEEDMWVRGAEIADSIGADLINSSLGYYEYDVPDYNHTWGDLGAGDVFVTRGAMIACQKGILVCNSAGNERQKDWQRVTFPADAEEVFTIGGTDAGLEPSYFTSIGWTVPNVKPDVSCRATASWMINADNGLPRNGNGTSFSSPLMCGLMASLWSADPQRTPAELRQIVRESASQYASPDSITGCGLPDFRKALAQVRPDIMGIEPVKVVEEGKNYNLQGQPAQPKGLCIRRRKVVFVR